MRNDDDVHHEAGAPEVSRAMGWLHLAATPAFALMALVTAVDNGRSMDMLCQATHAMFPLGDMTTMYLLMATFHAMPWLQLGLRRRHRLQHARLLD